MTNVTVRFSKDQIGSVSIRRHDVGNSYAKGKPSPFVAKWHKLIRKMNLNINIVIILYRIKIRPYLTTLDHTVLCL